MGNSVSEWLAQSKNLTRSARTELTDRVGAGVHNLSKWIRGAIDSISQTANRTREAIDKTIHWVRDTIDSTRHFFSTFSTDEIDEIIATWVVHHPILALIGVAVSIFLLMSLLQAIGRGIANTWVALLKSPLVLAKWLFRWGRKPSTENLEGTKYERQANILARLKAINQEQTQLLQELETLKRKNEQ